MFFAKQGPVGTVKIMWRECTPSWFFGLSLSMIARGEDLAQANRRGQTGLTGFVAYMKRSDAERAVRELDRLNWGGNVIYVAFSKSVAVPTRAIYGQCAAQPSLCS